MSECPRVECPSVRVSECPSLRVPVSALPASLPHRLPHVPLRTPSTRQNRQFGHVQGARARSCRGGCTGVPRDGVRVYLGTVDQAPCTRTRLPVPRPRLPVPVPDSALDPVLDSALDPVPDSALDPSLQPRTRHCSLGPVTAASMRQYEPQCVSPSLKSISL